MVQRDVGANPSARAGRHSNFAQVSVYVARHVGALFHNLIAMYIVIRELIAMRAVDEKRARILFRTMPLHTLSRHDVRYITANSRNIRKDTLIANISLPENLINALVGVQVTELTSSIKATKQSTKASTTTRNSASSPSTSSPTTPHTYSLQILRYSDNLGDIPWLDWYANRYLYFQTVLARLKRALPR